MLIEETIRIEAGDIQVDAVGNYDTGTGKLVSVHINGRDVPADELAAMLKQLAGDAYHDAWRAPIYTSAMLAEDAREHAADKAAYRRAV